MKKNGFTLAEVLITLAIIGVVATLTLPALMNNTQEQQFKTAFKKSISTLTNIGETSEAVDNFTYSDITDASAADQTDTATSASIYAMMATRGSVDLVASGTDATAAGTGLARQGASTGDNGNFAVFFRDGSVLMFPPAAGTAANAAEKAMQDDGLPLGIAAVVDVNGAKMPNALSNCAGDAGMSSGSAGDATANDCNVKANRVIKDRFGVRLRGHYAVPNGPAARWAFDN